MKKKLLFIMFNLLILRANSQTNNLKPGDIDPNAVYLEVDEMHPFNNGAALVKKGKSSGLIDSHGNFVVPFNKYNIHNEFGSVDVQELKSKFSYGLFTLMDGAEAGSLLTAEGKIIHNPDPARLFTFNIKNAEWVGKMAVGGNIWWVNTKTAQTQSVNIKTTVIDFSETDREYDLYPYRDPNTSLMGYRTFGGKVVIKPVYFSAGPFCNGMAHVSRYNSYQELKYGFVDTTGKESVPCSLSNPPSNFYNGMAIIFPKAGEDFDYACIDNKGNILKGWKLMNNNIDIRSFSGENTTTNKYIMGYRNQGAWLMDSVGKLIPSTEFMKLLGIKSPVGRFAYILLQEDRVMHKLYYSIPYNGPAVSNSIDRLGIFSINDKKEIQLPVANSIYATQQNSFVFDKKSGLAYAEVCLAKDVNGNTKLRKGYINEKGIFVIVMKAPSQF